MAALIESNTESELGGAAKVVSEAEMIGNYTLLAGNKKVNEVNHPQMRKCKSSCDISDNCDMLTISAITGRNPCSLQRSILQLSNSLSSAN
jgi:hypothetical protein